MMSDFNAILNVLECYDPVANFLVASGSFAGWEDVLQDLYYALPKSSSEILEYEVGVGL